MLNGQYVGCTTGFSQSDKTDIFIPNQTINTTATPYLERLVAVNLIKVEQTSEPMPIIEPIIIGEPVIVIGDGEGVYMPEPTIQPTNDGFWNATSRIDAYEKAGEIVKKMGDNQRFSITLANPDGTKQMTQSVSGRYLKHQMFGNAGGLYMTATVFGDEQTLGYQSNRSLSVGFSFVNENGVPTGYQGNGVTGKPYPDGAGFVSLEIQGENEFKIVPTGANNDLATLFGLEQPRWVTFADMANVRFNESPMLVLR